ncbi:zf-HC2 domain-containing protein [Metabacillus fastidiosus]|uniref:Zf-HC2 domain-containing protein n=1 Tax=Metabacillus fastidiosus TaxID=1458 RepID=A0ABU6NXG8_9BACI|nr:zf-HC2 domain-containing protein [Metabacillus fastidiosus]MED4401338.1 zf-HC2 domain-containing protein [Metabacillus fastidiosus]MED4461711.1 zf-HC2 domain-containing protein [Metabacillus fastidiosus]
MKDIKCTVIQDLLPLYVDEVVSDDTKLLVNEHLLTCENCRDEYEKMKGTLYVPIENKATLFSQLKKQWNRKKWLLIFGSVLTTTLIGFALFSFIFYYAKPIPYTAELFKLEETADGKLVLNYFGESHAGTHSTHPLEVEIDGEVKKISLIYCVKTIAHSPTSNFLREDKRIGPERLELIDSETVDAVYYGDFDLDKVTKEKEQTWEELLQQMTLIWER